MLYDAQIACATREEFDAAIETAKKLCLEMSLPIRLMGHCSPIKTKYGSKPGDGSGGIMFSVLHHYDHGGFKEFIYSVFTTFVIEREVFDISEILKKELRAAGKLINFADWEEDEVTHVITIPWAKSEWEYGFIATDDEAIITLLNLGGTKIRRAALQTDG